MAQRSFQQQKQQQKMKRKRATQNPLVRGILAFCAKSAIPVLDSTCITDTDTDSNTAAAAASIRDSTGSEEKTISSTSPSTETQDSTPPLSLSDIPKRYTSYPPLLLLPHNFTTHNRRWTEVYSALSDSDRTALFQCIAEIGFSAGHQKIDRIAINAPIAAEAQDDTTIDDTYGCLGPNVEEASGISKPQRQKENVMRSPSGLVPVYGDWGHTLNSVTNSNPTPRDFSIAFWTSTVQHKGITQCWAPLYTMFSRGNISEKARILGIPSGSSEGGGSGGRDNDTRRGSGNSNITFPGLTNENSHQKMDVIDFYVGIGYFAFCYLMRGVRTVYGWDINPWSIEGLRRGCEANGWSCLVIKVDEHGDMIDQTPTDVASSIIGQDEGEDDNGHDSVKQPEIRCVAFLGDNKWTHKVMGEISRAGVDLSIRHANLGLLPTSRGSWENAVKAIIGGRRHDNNKEGWLHVHENVEVRRIEKKKAEITHDISSLVKRQFSGQNSDMAWSVTCDDVQQVKTYAPGVMHCVYDVHVIQINPNG